MGVFFLDQELISSVSKVLSSNTSNLNRVETFFHCTKCQVDVTYLDILDDLFRGKTLHLYCGCARIIHVDVSKSEDLQGLGRALHMCAGAIQHFQVEPSKLPQGSRATYIVQGCLD